MTGAIEDSLLRMRDTNATKSALARKVDSLNTIPAPAGGDTSHKPFSALAGALQAVPDEDTAYAFWLHPFWGIGMGWGLGSNPLLTEWQSGLPDSAARLVGRGTKLSRFAIVEPVNSYNIFWPLQVSYTPLVTEGHSLSMDGSFYFLFADKSFKASVTAEGDSLSKAILSQSCAVTFFSLGFTYRRSVPEEYFKVEGVKRTTGNIGLSLVPYMRFSKRSSFTTAGAIPDSCLAVLRGNVDNRTFGGFGLSWKAGISSLKKLSPKSGLEVGLTYVGRYMGNFRNGSERMLWKDVNPSSGKPGQKVSFLSHTFEISLTLQNGKEAPRKPDTGIGVAKSAAVTDTSKQASAKDTAKAAAKGDSSTSASVKDSSKAPSVGGASKVKPAVDTVTTAAEGDASNAASAKDTKTAAKGTGISSATPAGTPSKTTAGGGTSKAATTDSPLKSPSGADTSKSVPTGGSAKRTR
jgi:hypothetical protein